MKISVLSDVQRFGVGGRGLSLGGKGLWVGRTLKVAQSLGALAHGPLLEPGGLGGRIYRLPPLPPTPPELDDEMARHIKADLNMISDHS